MRRLGSIVFANVVLGAAVVGLTPDHHLLDARLAWFGREVPVADFGLAPPALSARGFRSFLPEIRHEFAEQNASRIARVTRPELMGRATVGSVKALVRSFSRSGIEGGCGERSGDLIENIEWVVSGHGCCSDHSQVFIALSLLHDFLAREVSNRVHTFNEYWDDELGTWVWVDPQFARMATDDAGRHLGLLEIHERLRRRLPVRWDDFASPDHAVPSTSDGTVLYAPAQFGHLQLVLGNNVFQVDAWNRRLWMLPKPIRQFLLLAAGIEPGYAYANDRIGDGASVAPVLLPYRLALIAYLLSNVWALGWRWSRRRGRTCPGSAPPTASAPTPATRSPPVPVPPPPPGLLA